MFPSPGKIFFTVYAPAPVPVIGASDWPWEAFRAPIISSSPRHVLIQVNGVSVADHRRSLVSAAGLSATQNALSEAGGVPPRYVVQLSGNVRLLACHCP